MTKKNGKNEKKRRTWLLWLIVPIVLQLAGGGIWWTATKDTRAANAVFQQLVDFASQQQVEIAIIRQGMELRRLRAELAGEQQKIQSDLQNKLKPE